MNFDVLRSEVQEYIYKNENVPVAKLAFTKNPFPDIDFPVVLNQIAARQKFKTKLPPWYNTCNIIYPSKISVEQTSSEATALYKASLVSGNSLIDLTGGFGADDYYFAEKLGTVIHCEMDTMLSQIASHNFKQLGRNNIQCIAGDSLGTLKSLNRNFDTIYIDPARRHDTKGKVFMLKDCQPNIPALLDTYLEYTNTILIKTAPILDIAAGLTELKYVKTIYIVAVNNEVKELLWLISKSFTGTPEITAVAINNSFTSVFNSIINDDAASYAMPQQYLYEPNSAIMKSGLFNEVSRRFSIDKLHQHSHLYTSDKLTDFPGRRFVINDIVPYTKVDIKKHLDSKKMNITVRNFPMAVEELRKKHKIKEGGDVYAFFTTTLNNDKIVLLCSKI